MRRSKYDRSRAVALGDLPAGLDLARHAAVTMNYMRAAAALRSVIAGRAAIFRCRTASSRLALYKAMRPL